MRLRLAAVLLLTGVCLAGVFRGLDPAVAWSSLQAASWRDVGGVMLLYFGAHYLRVLRLQLLLEQPVGAKRLLSILSIGYLAIQVIPFRLGEFVRPYLLFEQEKIPFGTAMAAILLERLADMIMLLTMLLMLGWVVELPSGTFLIEGIDVVQAGQRLTGGLVAAGAAGVAAVLGLGERALRWTDRLPMGGLVRRFYEGVHLLARQPGRMAAVLGLSVAIWAITIAAVWRMLLAFPGLPDTFPQAFVIWTITLTGMTAIPTPGFFGSYEAACTGALTLFGAPLDPARTFALLLHLSQFLFTVVLGGGFLFYEGLSLREIVDRSRAAAAGRSGDGSVKRPAGEDG